MVNLDPANEGHKYKCKVDISGVFYAPAYGSTHHDRSTHHDNMIMDRSSLPLRYRRDSQQREPEGRSAALLRAWREVQILYGRRWSQNSYL